MCPNIHAYLFSVVQAHNSIAAVLYIIFLYTKNIKPRGILWKWYLCINENNINNNSRSNLAQNSNQLQLCHIFKIVGYYLKLPRRQVNTCRRNSFRSIPYEYVGSQAVVHEVPKTKELFDRQELHRRLQFPVI